MFGGHVEVDGVAEPHESGTTGGNTDQQVHHELGLVLVVHLLPRFSRDTHLVHGRSGIVLQSLASDLGGQDGSGGEKSSDHFHV